MKTIIRAFLLFMFFAAGCASPEANRTRGGGPGGDMGNRSGTVRMHEGSKPYYRTPQISPGQHAPLAGAQQAYDTSRR
jgi:hypothetical protein